MYETFKEWMRDLVNVWDVRKCLRHLDWMVLDQIEWLSDQREKTNWMVWETINSSVSAWVSKRALLASYSLNFCKLHFWQIWVNDDMMVLTENIWFAGSTFQSTNISWNVNLVFTLFEAEASWGHRGSAGGEWLAALKQNIIADHWWINRWTWLWRPDQISD